MTWENAFLRYVKEGIEPTHESNTSRYVHEALLRCLEWPLDRIVPQVGRRGFIDYVLSVEDPNSSIRVEVKGFSVGLGPSAVDQLRRYMVRLGRPTKRYRVGVLTDFRRWRVFLSGPAVVTVSGRSMVEAADLRIGSQHDVRRLRRLIGHRATSSYAMLVRELGASRDVVKWLARKSKPVLRAIRADISRQPGVTKAPTYAALKQQVRAVVLRKKFPKNASYPRRVVARAVSSPEVAEVMSKILRQEFSAAGTLARLQQTARSIANRPE